MCGLCYWMLKIYSFKLAAEQEPDTVSESFSTELSYENVRSIRSILYSITKKTLSWTIFVKVLDQIREQTWEFLVTQSSLRLFQYAVDTSI